MNAKIAAVSAELDAWIEAQNFRGWDPFDALNSPLLKRLTLNNRRIGQMWVQLLKRSPVNLRPILGVPKGYNPKGMGLFLETYTRKYQCTGDEHMLNRAHYFADWLRENATPGYHGACWGYNFDWPNRGFFAPAGTPTIVNTAFIGLAFIQWSTLDLNRHTLEIAHSACSFILKDLNTLRPANDELCFSYTPLDQRYVHNANVLGAWLLAEVAARSGEQNLKDAALAAANYTVRRQRADGSWLYGEGSSDNWVDNFHTGYVLVALRRISELLGDDRFAAAIGLGYAYWKDMFFTPQLAPRYYADRDYPIDIHSVSQAILTFLCFSDLDNQAHALAYRSADWAIDHMWSPSGFFDYQINRFYRCRIPYMRWSQAWMQRAFTELLSSDSPLD